MSGGSRIIAFGSSGEGQAVQAEDERVRTDHAAEPALDLSEWVEEPYEQPVEQGRQRLADRLFAAVAIVAVLGWTGFYAWANRSIAAAAIAPVEWAGLIAGWSMPVALVCMAWLIFMRSGTREAARFGETARLVSRESALLETRLLTVNRELSLAREFIAAQARDLEALGRMAGERLSANADRLEALISENGSRVETIGRVSEAALDNMEKLRGQLPVIASSAKDVTNNIANAGRTAHGQIEELVRGFNRINEFAQASETQVFALRDHVGQTLTGLEEQCSRLQTVATARFDEIVSRSDDFRTRLDRQEIDALAAIRTRAGALAEELEAARQATQDGEYRTLEILGARLATLREESDRIGQSLEERADAQRACAEDVARRAELLADRLASSQANIELIARNAHQWEDRIGQTMTSLTERMNEARGMLGAAEDQIGGLTESSLRLFELVRASADQAGKVLPGAMSQTDDALSGLERRTVALVAALRQAGEDSVSLSGEVDSSKAALGEMVAGIDSAQAGLRSRTGEHLEMLGRLAASLAEIDEKNDTVARKARGQLADAITEMELAARQTLGMIDAQAAAGIETIASEIKSRSAQAVGTAIHQAVSEISGQLAQAASHAAGVSREATIQLRDQLAKVHELVGNLESRVARARERAEEQVDNDFARRAALITESLNSNAIDIARALSADVSNTAWEGYLRGDRGIFTRRAVTLIDNADARAIQQAFERDDDFRDHVSRYIHDFEAMLRQVLSTRDGTALGVTLLSSDMGKLYVALAQAIDRLRT